MTATWGYGVWLVLAVAALVVWAFSHRAPGRRRGPARPSIVFARLATDPWLRVPLLIAWAWVGWHLFAR
jgi:hypothetical protein